MKKHFLLDYPFYNNLEGNALKLCFLVVKNIDFNKLDLTKYNTTNRNMLFKNGDTECLAFLLKKTMGFYMYEQQKIFLFLNNCITYSIDYTRLLL